MFTLYYAAGASSLSAHILLAKSHLPYRLEKVNLDTHTTDSVSYLDINPKQYVPALQLESGTILTECAVILEYIGLNSSPTLIPSYNSPKYWQARVWLNYIATELHKNFISPFRTGNWLPNTDDSRQLIWQRVYPRLNYVNQQLASRSYLLGQQFTAPDAYLFVMTNWLQRLHLPLNRFPNMQKFDQQLRSDPTVQSVLTLEGAPHSLQE